MAPAQREHAHPTGKVRVVHEEVLPLRRQLPPHCMHANAPTVLFLVRSVRPAASQLQAQGVMRNLPFPPLGNSTAHLCVLLPDRFQSSSVSSFTAQTVQDGCSSEGAPHRLRARHWNQRKAPVQLCFNNTLRWRRKAALTANPRSSRQPVSHTLQPPRIGQCSSLPWIIHTECITCIIDARIA